MWNKIWQFLKDLLGALLGAPPPEPPPQDPPPDPPPGETPEGSYLLVQAVNNFRLQHSLTPLSLEQRLLRAAVGHAEWMASNRVMSHVGAGGSSPFQRIMAVGYYYRSAGENVAAGYRTVGAVMEGWANSPGHRANMLGAWLDIGAAVAKDVDGKSYWVLVFAIPQSRSVYENSEYLQTCPEPLAAPE